MRITHVLVLTCSLILSACGSEEGDTGLGGSGNGDTGLGGSNEITLSWYAPTENVDSSCTDDLLGFEIHYGNNSGQYSDSIPLWIGDASCVDSSIISENPECGTIPICNYTLTGLPAASWHLAIRAYDEGLNQSPFSNEITRVVTN